MFFLVLKKSENVTSNPHPCSEKRPRYNRQCCGSGMIIPDPNLSIRIRNRIKEVFLTQKMVFKLLEILSGIFIPDPDPDFLPIPDPGVKKAPDPGSGSATLVICIRVN
jgi:hypothetical protein